MSFGYGYGARRTHDNIARDRDGNRVQKVHENSMVAHLWANQSQDFATSGNGNFYFTGRTLWSYGEHYAVGVMARANGEKVAFLNGEENSITTGRHKTYARRALNYRDYYEVPDLTAIQAALVACSSFPTIDNPGIVERITGHVAKHVLQIDAQTAIALYAVAGKRLTEKQFEALRTKAENTARREQAARDKAATKTLLGKAAKIAAWTPGYLDGVLREISLHTLRFQIRELRTIHKAASKAGKTTHKVKVWAVIKACVAAVKIVERRENIRYQRQTLRRDIRDLRLTLTSHAAGDLRAFGYQGLASVARRLALVPRLGKARAALLDTSAAATAEAERLAPIEAEAARVKREKVAAERAEREAQSRADWFAGISNFRFSTPEGTAYIRAVAIVRDAGGAIVSGRLETSHGANVPLVDAIKVFRMVKLCRDRETGWTRNGATLPVGMFAVDWIKSNGNFQAGCHRINWTEIEALARELDVLDLPAANTTRETAHA